MSPSGKKAVGAKRKPRYRKASDSWDEDNQAAESEVSELDSSRAGQRKSSNSRRDEDLRDDSERRRSSTSGTLPRFSISDEAEIGSISDMGFENPRFTTKGGRASLLESCIPTRSSIDFYSRQEEAKSTTSRQSRLAEELGQMEITEQLISSRFSQSVVSDVLATNSMSGVRARGPPRHSLCYPEVGKLDLDKFLAQSDTDDELSSDDGKPRKGGKKK